MTYKEETSVQETREQSLAKMEHYTRNLSDRELRLVVAFTRGLASSKHDAQ